MDNKLIFGKLRYDGNDCYVFDDGLTLRDYFAGLAMQGLVSDPDLSDKQAAAKWAYSMADAMLKERSK